VIDLDDLLKNLMNKDFCYFIGVIQGDGTCRKYIDRTKNKKRLCLFLAGKDIEMVSRSANIFNSTFRKNVGIFRRSRDNLFGFSTTVNSLAYFFNKLKIDFSDPPKAPNWIKNNEDLFGSYLAGLIDSDGSVCIKRKKYPQCKVNIISGHPQHDLKKSIEKNLKCKASIEESGGIMKSTGKWYPGFDLVFLVSSKNREFVRKNVLPFITIPRKRETIEKYLKIHSE